MAENLLSESFKEAAVSYLDQYTVKKVSPYILADEPGMLKSIHHHPTLLMMFIPLSLPPLQTTCWPTTTCYSYGLAGVFINLEGVFPCISGHDMPTCSRATYEEDRQIVVILM